MKKYDNFLKALQEAKHVVPFQLKNYVNIIKDDIKYETSTFKKDFDFSSTDDFPISFTLNVVFNYSYRSNYNAVIDILKIAENNFVNFEIKIIIDDISINKNKLISIIHHELRHIYDVLVCTDDYDINSFVDEQVIRRLRDEYPVFYNFFSLVILSLEHEMVARNSMLYHYLKDLDLKDRENNWKYVKDTFSYKYLLELKKFDSNVFINSFKTDKLIEVTNEYLTRFKKPKINSIIELSKFYTDFEKHFKDKADEYMEYINHTIDDVLNDNKIVENIIHKRYKTHYCYSENVLDSYSIRFSNLLDKILLKTF